MLTHRRDDLGDLRRAVGASKHIEKLEVIEGSTPDQGQEFI
jgi:hypothetical protein